MERNDTNFDAGELQHDLKGKVARAGLYSVVATLTTQVLHVLAIVILARLLLPEDFGLVGMVTVLTLFAERVKHLGLSTATIQQKDITHEQVSTLFWINVSTGVLIALVIMASSRGIAVFYQEASLSSIAMVLSLSFIFGGLNVQHEALLRRRMQFRALAVVQILGSVLSLCVAIELAVNGFGYWALVWKEVTRPAVEMVGIWLSCRWWPGWPASVSQVKSLLHIGKNVVGADMVLLACRSVDQLLLGKFAGAQALGLYKAAYQLTFHPMSTLTYPVGNVALPGLSALQDQPIRYERYYLKILGILSFLMIPLITYMVIFSEDIVKVVLGEKWLGATWTFRFLAIGALVDPLFFMSGIVMITQGLSRRCFWWTIVQGTTTVFAYCIGIYWESIGIAIAYAVVQYTLVIPCLAVAFKGTPLSIRRVLETVAMPALFSAIMATILLLVSQNTMSLESTSRIGISILVSASSYLGLWMIHPRGKEIFYEDIAFLLSIVRPARGISS